MRVFSDGVPERDYPGGCQLAVLCEPKGNYLTEENLDGEADAAVETLSGCEDESYEEQPHAFTLTSPRASRQLSVYLGVSALVGGSVPHHHIRGNARCRGQTSFSVSPSYNRPFFMT